MKKMATWSDYLKMEENHRENVGDTIEFFKWVLNKFGKLVTSINYEFALEIGSGISRGYLPLLNVSNSLMVDYVHGPIKEKAEELSFSDNSFDLVIISNTLDHCEDPVKVAAEIQRVLKKGGLLFIFNYLEEPDNHPWSFSTSEEILDLFKGLEVLKSDMVPKTKGSPFMVATLRK